MQMKNKGQLQSDRLGDMSVKEFIDKELEI